MTPAQVKYQLLPPLQEISISKAFDKVLHEVLILKLKEDGGTSGNLLIFYVNFREIENKEF